MDGSREILPLGSGATWKKKINNIKNMAQSNAVGTLQRHGKSFADSTTIIASIAGAS